MIEVETIITGFVGFFVVVIGLLLLWFWVEAPFV
jgi:hypothetical protein